MHDTITPQILPHPKRGTMEIGTERIMPVWCSFRAAEGATAEKPILTVVGTDGSEDRHGSVINPDGWEIDAYMRNPVVLWQHGENSDHPPVGKTLAMRKVGGAWESDIELFVNLWRHMQSNIAAFLWEAYRDHAMGAISVSFIPKKWKDRKATDIPSFFSEDTEYEKQEMTEQSFVNVPSNRNGLAKAIERARSAGTFNDGLARMLGYAVSPIVVKPAKELLMPTRTVESLRASFADVLKRCCGCEPYREPKPEISEEQKSAEVVRLTSLVKTYLATMDLALEGWRANAAIATVNIYSNMVVDSMYRIEGLIYRAKDWYGADIAIDAPAYEPDEMQRVIASTAKNVVLETVRAARRSRLTPDARKAACERMAEILRCCGCYPYEEETPTLPTDDAKRAEEAMFLRECADAAMTQVELGMLIWTSAETAQLRSAGQDLVAGGMWRYDTAVRYLDTWYGEELEAVPDVDLEEVERALSSHEHRAGAVFAKKNLEKIDQVIAIMGELRAAANKPTPEDVPDEERKRMARAAQFTRTAGPFEFASTQVNIEGEVAEQVRALGAAIPDEVLADNGRETDVHVTIKYGIDPSVDIASMKDAIENSDSAKEMAQRGGGTMTLGATAIFEADEYDVVYVGVDSEDLVLLNKSISEAVPVTDTHPEYVPHITIAYVKKGEGQKYVGDETLKGTIVTFDAIQFSDTEGNLTEIPLAGESAIEPAAERSTGPLTIRIKDTGGVTREPVSASQTIRVLAPDAARGRTAESPSDQRPLYVTLLST